MQVFKQSAGKAARMLAPILICAVVQVFAVMSAKAGENEEPAFHWESLSAHKPYATTRKEAIKRRVEAFSVVDLPRPIVTLMMRATWEPGKKVRIEAGYHFARMVLKGPVVRRDVIVMVNEPLSAEKWTIQLDDGRTLSVFLISAPDESYFNWGIKLSVKTGIIARSPLGAERISTVARAT